MKGSAGAPEPEPDDVALVLHTSGTTSRPKIVPLKQRNISASARSIARHLRLAPEDRCLNVMPLFHIHGLIGATLSTIAGGGSIVCTQGFYVTDLFDWIEEFHPTWYTAVPTMHQAILDRAEIHKEVLLRAKLRFIRSSSAALPPSVAIDLEEAFRAPVIEAYGMTEASHEMSSNPLPPASRKRGSVGRGTGVEVAIMDDAGSLLEQGTTGEIVIRGPGVTAGYENNAEANATSFVDGWFRTGDQGHLDDDGYLFITGRIKELINRGGEMISPREVDEVLLEHPAVAQAVTFALPDERLGEEVAAAVKLKQGATTTSEELRAFAAEKLAAFKVPVHFEFVDDVPKGPTGKVQRIGLAERLGVTTGEETAGPPIAPRTDLERALAKLWSEVLGKDVSAVNREFLELGGDSMLATRLIDRISEDFELTVSIIAFFDAPTIELQARLLAEDLKGSR